MSLTTSDIYANRDRLFTLRRNGGGDGRYPGVRFVHGVAEKVTFRHARRMKAALGSDLEVTFYEEPKKVPAAPKPAAKAKADDDTAPKFHPAAAQATETHVRRRAKAGTRKTKSSD